MLNVSDETSPFTTIEMAVRTRNNQHQPITGGDGGSDVGGGYGDNGGGDNGSAMMMVVVVVTHYKLANHNFLQPATGNLHTSIYVLTE